MTVDQAGRLGESGRVDKAAARRLELAESALKTIGEMGYARSSLREIAANSKFSHGVVHYYFSDKIELVAFCVRVYKTECSQRYDDIVASAGTSDELIKGVLDAMAATLVVDLPLHRLWYDLRAQAMFEPRLRDDVDHIENLLERMAWRIVSRYAQLNTAAVVTDPASAYAIVDGLFSQAVLRCGDDAETASRELVARLRSALPLLIGS